MGDNFIESHKVIHLSTEAMRDRWNGGWSSDVIHMREYSGILFIIDQTSGVGAAELTVRSADDTTPTTTSGISEAWYRASTTPDTWGAWTKLSSSSGFVTAITPDKTYEIYVPASSLSGTNEYIFLDAVESTNSPVDVNCLAILIGPKSAEDVDAVSSLT